MQGLCGGRHRFFHHFLQLRNIHRHAPPSTLSTLSLEVEVLRAVDLDAIVTEE